MTISRTSKLAVLLTLAFAIGCGETDKPAPAPAITSAGSNGPKKHRHSHPHAGHGAGPHHGTVADWGGGKFHVEFTVDHDKQEATVYVLGDDEKTPSPIKTSMILLSINNPMFQVELAAAPLEGEAEGSSSRFVGKHEGLGKVQNFAGTISGEVEGTPYAGDFKEEPHSDHK